MPIPIEALNSILQGKRTLPNGGGNYSVANSSPMTMGQNAPVVQQPAMPLMQPAQQPQQAASAPVTPPVSTPIAQAPISAMPQATPNTEATPEELSKLQSIADRVVSGSYSPMGQSYLDGSASGVSDSVALRREMMRDRAQGTGLYSIPKGTFATPEQIFGIRKMADDHYNQLINTASEDEKTKATLAAKLDKPELTAGQASAFNSIVSAKNRSPLLAAADRLPVLENSIRDVRANPSNGALQLNLAYSYIQALDTYQSAVREGELSLVNSIDSKVGQLGNFVSQIQNGQIVRPEVIKQMADAAENIVKTINTSAKQKSQSFKAQAEAQGLGDVWNRYEGGYESSFDKKVNPDQEALDAGYTQEEIDAFKEKQGFSTVGNTSASVSVEIPKTSRLSFVNNNPGNLRFAGQSGASQGEGGFAKFNTPEEGVKALTRQIQLDASRGHTLSSFISKFAPPTENDTNTYISQAVKNLGVNPSTPIAQIPQDKLTQFMAMKESSTKIS